MTSAEQEHRAPGSIAVVIPCFRVKDQILDVLAGIGDEVDRIYVVDDACPEGSGAYVEERSCDPRVQVLVHPENRGVGGAVLTGYRAAFEDGADVIVKLDGDGQMDPALIPTIVQPILVGEADYTKGNRFFELEGLRAMPGVRLIGNSALTLINKAASGYWNINDPTNGFTAIHVELARRLPLDKLHERYFFESDMLFRIGTLRGVIVDVPMTARYANEKSSLVPHRVIGLFLGKHISNTVKRLFYGYLLRDFNIATIEILAGAVLILFGVLFGASQWAAGSEVGALNSSGTVMLAALPIILGVQLTLAFLTFDVQNIPRDVLHRRLAPTRKRS